MFSPGAAGIGYSRGVSGQPPVSATELELACDAQRCFELLCAVERVAEWVPGVADVTVVSNDRHGRPTRATFVAMPSRASMSYTLDYVYRESADGVRSVSWSSQSGDGRVLMGRAIVRALTDVRCALRYEVDAAVVDGVPSWAEESLLNEQPEPLAKSFARWLERQLA